MQVRQPEQGLIVFRVGDSVAFISRTGAADKLNKVCE